MAGTAASGINITWVESAGDDTSGFGPIMLQRYQVVLDEAGDPTGLLPAGISSRNEAHVFRASADALAVGAANDNALVIAESGRVLVLMIRHPPRSPLFPYTTLIRL